MVTLFQKQQIILKAFLEGKSQRQIAKEVGINRKTGKKNIIQYAKAKKELLKNSNVENEIEAFDHPAGNPGRITIFPFNTSGKMPYNPCTSNREATPIS